MSKLKDNINQTIEKNQWFFSNKILLILVIALLTFAACDALFDCVRAWTDPNAALEVAKDRLIKKTAREINSVREGTSEAQRTGLKALGYAMLQEHDFNKDVQGYKYANPIVVAIFVAINWFLLKRLMSLGKGSSQPKS